MATFSSALITAQKSNRLPEGFLTGRTVRRAFINHVATGAFVANSVIELVMLPPGAKIIPHLCRVSHQGAATTLTVKLQDNATAPNILTSATAVNALAADGVGFASENLEQPLQDDGQVNLLVVTEAASAAGDVIQACIAYVPLAAA